MVQIVKAVKEVPGTFQAIFNVAMNLPVNMYAGVKKYNEEFLKKVVEINGSDTKLPPKMSHRHFSRGDIISIGEEAVVNEETGNVEVWPKSVFKELNAMKVELPCAVMGNVTETYDKALAALPKHMRDELAKNREKTVARFRVEPFIEKYVGQVLED